MRARPASGEPKKGADKGVDGYRTFYDDDSGKSKKVVVQVKSGHVSSQTIRDLKGTMEGQKAEIGALVTLQESTGPMRDEALSAGLYEPPTLLPPVPCLQILTIHGLLDGTERLECPDIAPTTFKRAPRRTKIKKGAEPPHSS